MEATTTNNFTTHTFGPEEFNNYRKRMILWQWVLVVEGKMKHTEISLTFRY